MHAEGEIFQKGKITAGKQRQSLESLPYFFSPVSVSHFVSSDLFLLEKNRVKESTNQALSHTDPNSFT